MTTDSIAITSHAVERFVQRHAPDMTYQGARTYLKKEAHKARRLKEKTLKGDTQWELEDPYCILVMKRDYRSRDWVCVTVLPEAQGREIPDDEMDIIREHLLDRAENSSDVTAGAVEDTLIEKFFSAPNQPALLKPREHYSPEAETARVNHEKKLWNRILDMKNAQFKKTRGREIQEQMDQAIVGSLRLLIEGLRSGEDSQVLLDRVAQLDPALLTDAFLRPDMYHRTERKEIMEKVRREAGILC